MGSDVGQIIPTANLHRDHSILYALVCEKELSHMGKNNGNPDQEKRAIISLVQDSLEALCCVLEQVSSA